MNTYRKFRQFLPFRVYSRIKELDRCVVEFPIPLDGSESVVGPPRNIRLKEEQKTKINQTCRVNSTRNPSK